jgi:hypothetical protein
MGNVISETIGKIATLVGFDGSDFHPIATDSNGQAKALVGYDGADYHLIKTDADGRPEIKVSGQVPDADTVDGHHADEFADGVDGVAVNSDKLDNLHASDFALAGQAGVLDAEYVCTAASAGLSAEVVIPGLAGSPDKVPSSPSAQDDEFDSSSLNAKWTKASTAPNDDVDTTWPSCAYVNFTGNQYYFLAENYAAATAFSISARLFCALMALSQAVGLSAYDDDESEGAQIIIQYTSAGLNTALLRTMTGGGAWTTRATLALGVAGNVYYLHLQRDGSNVWSAWYSHDGHSFFRIGTYTFTFTVHHIQLALVQSGATVPVRVGVDWIRRDWVTL